MSDRRPTRSKERGSQVVQIVDAGAEQRSLIADNSTLRRRRRPKTRNGAAEGKRFDNEDFVRFPPMRTVRLQASRSTRLMPGLGAFQTSMQHRRKQCSAFGKFASTASRPPKAHSGHTCHKAGSRGGTILPFRPVQRALQNEGPVHCRFEFRCRIMRYARR